VLPISSDAGAQRSTPLVNCLVDYMLLQTRPRSRQEPLQISNVEYGRAVGMYNAPDSIDHFASRLFSGHRSRALECDVAGARSARVSRARCVGGCHFVKLEVFTRYNTNI